MNKTSKICLIICRVENVTKAPSWTQYKSETFDCLISQYGETYDKNYHYYPGGKWIGIHDLLSQNPHLKKKYDFFWFPDDDIETTPEEISKFIKICCSEQFQLAQPALTENSFYAYRLTIANPKFQFRRTNFVELMMPLLKRDLLQRVLPLFSKKHAALGIDWIWHKFTNEPRNQVAIVDAVKMGHYRPRNNHLASRMKTIYGIDIWDERKKTMKELHIPPLKPLIYSGRLLDGREVTSFKLVIETILGYYSIRRKIKQHHWTFKNYAHFLNSIRPKT